MCPRYLQPLIDRIARGEIDPSFLITHRYNLAEAPQAYEKFRSHRDGCVKVVLNPN